MSTFKRLTEVFDSAREITFDDSDKIIFFSDCHRGDGSWSELESLLVVYEGRASFRVCPWMERRA